MGTLLAGQQRFAILRKRLRQASRLPGEGGSFAAQELKPVAAQRAARPIPPEEGSIRRQRERRRQGWRGRGRERIRRQRPEHGTDPARFLGGRMLLTLLPQEASMAEANATRVQHAQRAIVFRSALLRVEGTISRAAQRAVGLQR